MSFCLSCLGLVESWIYELVFYMKSEKFLSSFPSFFPHITSLYPLALSWLLLGLQLHVLLLVTVPYFTEILFTSPYLRFNNFYSSVFKVTDTFFFLQFIIYLQVYLINIFQVFFQYQNAHFSFIVCIFSTTIL